MLYPHSFLWHYLWLGPSVLLSALALLSWRRKLQKIFPAFFAYLVFEGVQGFTMWVLDVAPGVSNNAYYRSDIAGLTMEALVKWFVIWELFSHLVSQRPALRGLGVKLIAGVGAVLAFSASMAAAHAHIGPYALMSYRQVVEQTIYLIEAGFLLFTFLFAARFHLAWERRAFGIALGLSISACIGLAVTAIYANGIHFAKYYLLDFFSMSVYHGCVVLWWYYLLLPNVPVPNGVNFLDPVREISEVPSARQRLPA